MRLRLLALAALPLLLTACGPAPAPEVSETVPSEVQEGAAAGPAIELPADGVLGVRATATAGNGAALEIVMVVHQAVPAIDPASTDARAATAAWCAGEVDEQLFTDEAYTFTTVEVTATAIDGDWPQGLAIRLLPEPAAGFTLTATGDLAQAPGSTPHCATPVTLNGGGSGTILLGISGDADGDADGTPPLGGWTRNLYGVDASTSDLSFTACVVVYSELCTSLGAGTASG